MSATSFALVETALGICGLAWSGQGIAAVALPEDDPARLRREDPAQRAKSWYMLLFQFPGVAETWLSADDFLNLREFVFVTKHGTYIDLFAGPQRHEQEDSWSVEQVLLQVWIPLHDPDVAEHFVQHPRRAAGAAFGAQFVEQAPAGVAEQADHDLPVGERGVVVGNLAQACRRIERVRCRGVGGL